MFCANSEGHGKLNKSELVDHVAESADISKAAATRAVESALEAITQFLSNGESVALVGFGTFWCASALRVLAGTRRPVRQFRLLLQKFLPFKAGKALKDALN